MNQAADTPDGGEPSGVEGDHGAILDACATAPCRMRNGSTCHTTRKSSSSSRTADAPTGHWVRVIFVGRVHRTLRMLADLRVGKIRGPFALRRSGSFQAASRGALCIARCLYGATIWAATPPTSTLTLLRARKCAHRRGPRGNGQGP